MIDIVLLITCVKCHAVLKCCFDTEIRENVGHDVMVVFFPRSVNTEMHRTVFATGVVVTSVAS